LTVQTFSEHALTIRLYSDSVNINIQLQRLLEKH